MCCLCVFYGQDSEQTAIDEKCQAFAELIRDKQFLSCFVHALEEQKNFSIRDKWVRDM